MRHVFTSQAKDEETLKAVSLQSVEEDMESILMNNYRRYEPQRMTPSSCAH